MYLRSVKIALILLFVYSHSVMSAQTKSLTAAIGEGYKDGLHAKYLRYIAKQLETEIELIRMPYTRRVKELQKGSLDIMVGLQCNHAQYRGVINISPPYESLSYAIYVQSGTRYQLRQYDNLKGKIVGVNQSGAFNPKFDLDDDISKVRALNLTQKIEMLQHGYIDAFVHLEQATNQKLTRLALAKKIVKSAYQSAYQNQYCIAISDKSPLIAEQQALSDIVRHGIQQGHFQQIRQQHYDQLAVQ